MQAWTIPCPLFRPPSQKQTAASVFFSCASWAKMPGRRKSGASPAGSLWKSRPPLELLRLLPRRSPVSSADICSSFSASFCPRFWLHSILATMHRTFLSPNRATSCVAQTRKQRAAVSTPCWRVQAWGERATSGGRRRMCTPSATTSVRATPCPIWTKSSTSRLHGKARRLTCCTASTPSVGTTVGRRSTNTILRAFRPMSTRPRASRP